MIVNHVKFKMPVNRYLKHCSAQKFFRGRTSHTVSSNLTSTFTVRPFSNCNSSVWRVAIHCPKIYASTRELHTYNAALYGEICLPSRCINECVVRYYCSTNKKPETLENSKIHNNKNDEKTENMEIHSEEKESSEDKNSATEQKPGLIKRFKIMYKEYWYVLLPVHLVTSTVWFVSFYYLAKSGVDIAGIMEKVGMSENMVSKFKSGGHATTGYIAIAYALYKIFTPLRYMVTLGGTTVSIKYLKEWGYIKPIPPKEKLKEIYHEKKDIIIEKTDTLKELYKEQKETLKAESYSSYFKRILGKFRLKRTK